MEPDTKFLDTIDKRLERMEKDEAEFRASEKKRFAETSEANGKRIKALEEFNTKALADIAAEKKAREDLEVQVKKFRFGSGGDMVGETDVLRNNLPDDLKPWISRIASRAAQAAESVRSQSIRIKDAAGEVREVRLEFHDADVYRQQRISEVTARLCQQDPAKMTAVFGWFQAVIGAKHAARAGTRALVEQFEKRIALLNKLLGGTCRLKENESVCDYPEPDQTKALGDLDLTESTNAEGGFLVPVEVYTVIEKLLRDSSVLRTSGVRSLPMRAEKLTLPRRDQVPVVYFPAEGAAPSDDVYTVAPFAGPQLVAEKQIGLQLITMELIMDNVANVVDFIFEDIIREMGTQEDVQGFQGTGSPFTGLASAASVVDVTKTPAALVAADWLNLLFAIKHRDVIDNGVVHCHPNVIKDLLTVHAGANNQYFMWGMQFPAVFSGQGQPLTSKRIYTSGIHAQNLGGGANETFPYHGNTRGLVFGDRMDFALDLNDRGDTPFKQGQAWLRVLRRVGYVVWVPTLWARHQDLQITTT